MSLEIEIAIETVFIVNIPNCIWLNIFVSFSKLYFSASPNVSFDLRVEREVLSWGRVSLASETGLDPPVWRLDHHAIHTEEEEEEEDNNNEEEEVRPNTTPPTSLQMVKP